jgi:hypothetical protein
MSVMPIDPETNTRFIGAKGLVLPLGGGYPLGTCGFNGGYD